MTPEQEKEFDKIFPDITIKGPQGGTYPGKNRVQAFISRLLTEQKIELSRCGRPIENNTAICRVKLDCHLHDWRQREAIDAALAEQKERAIACVPEETDCPHEIGHDAYQEHCQIYGTTCEHEGWNAARAATLDALKRL